jgi:hypothetical protein
MLPVKHGGILHRYLTTGGRERRRVADVGGREDETCRIAIEYHSVFLPISL